jgi:hypothetical protein
MSRDRKVKLELTVSEAVALYYAAGALRDDVICALDKTTDHPPVSGSRKTDRLILKSLDLLAAAIRKATGLLTALAIVGGLATARAELLTRTLRAFDRSSHLPWPAWAKVLMGFGLAIALFFFVLAAQQWQAKRESTQSRRLRHGSKRK